MRSRTAESRSLRSSSFIRSLYPPWPGDPAVAGAWTLGAPQPVSPGVPCGCSLRRMPAAFEALGSGSFQPAIGRVAENLIAVIGSSKSARCWILNCSRGERPGRSSSTSGSAGSNSIPGQPLDQRRSPPDTTRSSRSRSGSRRRSLHWPTGTRTSKCALARQCSTATRTCGRRRW